VIGLLTSYADPQKHDGNYDQDSGDRGDGHCHGDHRLSGPIGAVSA
jgi:hypothetical protein